ncbi:hypothetical protein BDZ90DRAFT_37134 [Jaminaea rosea]|uniref:BRCT domain-containing protein n=1 Tax=Jaminaea rosea TaxID=1569628 RepID=A0A316V1L7_9BASI|nr:hypothetical protein BDZ90DRAFT_37134 [Jaminaea rosea]PWN31154.1 hypothetical protein BDZ90DRAFT_37134 [Jaminaea rosea]
MAHRGHKSSKVPNVKLRPTNPGSSSRLEGGGGARAASSSSSPPPTSPHPDGDGGHDGEYDDGEDGGGDKDRPLKGWMFCFTGVTQEKTTLTQQLYSMGGMAEGNLTESTTHLIAYKVGSSKYDCAIQLGLPILLPSFITELHEQWQKAQENIDIDGLLREHTMPPLAGLKVGLCGLTENTRKLATRKLIKELGAELVVPMRFDADVTHLVCAQADVRPSTTLTHAKKYRAGKMGTQENQRAAQQLACVHLEWLKDCERARALLPPHDYDAWPCGKGPTSTVRAAAIQSIPDRAERALKERVKEVMQREEERKREAEPPRPTRSNGTATAVGRVSKKIAAESQLPEHESITPRGLLGLSREVADAAERSELRKAPDSTPLEEEERADREKRDDPPAKDKEDAKPADPPAAAPAPAAPCAPSAPAPPASRGIFSNLTFRLLSCPSDRLPLLRSALYGAGASDVVAGTVEGAAADYCLLSSASSPAPPDLPSTYGQPVTLHWLDQCLFYERVVEPTSAPWLRPPGLALPLPAASQCVVALTGFPLNGETPERQQLRKALETVGCKVTDTFAARENTHLLSARAVECRSLDQAEMESKGWIKEARAIKWGTPLVGVEWVERIWREGRVEPAPKTKGDGQLSESALAETQIASSSRPSSSSSEPQHGDYVSGSAGREGEAAVGGSTGCATAGRRGEYDADAE